MVLAQCRHALVAGFIVAGLTTSVFADGDTGQLTREKAEAAFKQPPAYSPYAGRNFPTRPFFGDTHLHTAILVRCRRVRRAADAARRLPFRRGEEVTASSGQPVKLSRPLDFLVVADHSDNMGFFPDLLAGKPEVLADPTGRAGTT